MKMVGIVLSPHAVDSVNNIMVNGVEVSEVCILSARCMELDAKVACLVNTNKRLEKNLADMHKERNACIENGNVVVSALIKEIKTLNMCVENSDATIIALNGALKTATANNMAARDCIKGASR